MKHCFPVKAIELEERSNAFPFLSFGSDIQARIIDGTECDPGGVPGADAGSAAEPPVGADDSFLPFCHPRPYRPDASNDDGASSASCAASAGPPGPRSAGPGPPTHPASPSRHPHTRSAREGEWFLRSWLRIGVVRCLSWVGRAAAPVSVPALHRWSFVLRQTTTVWSKDSCLEKASSSLLSRKGACGNPS